MMSHLRRLRLTAHGVGRLYPIDSGIMSCFHLFRSPTCGVDSLHEFGSMWDIRGALNVGKDWSQFERRMFVEPGGSEE